MVNPCEHHFEQHKTFHENESNVGNAVNMADPHDVRATFKQTAGGNDSSVVDDQGRLSFSDPYEKVAFKFDWHGSASNSADLEKDFLQAYRSLQQDDSKNFPAALADLQNFEGKIGNEPGGQSFSFSFDSRSTLPTDNCPAQPPSAGETPPDHSGGRGNSPKDGPAFQPPSSTDGGSTGTATNDGSTSAPPASTDGVPTGPGNGKPNGAGEGGDQPVTGRTPDHSGSFAVDQNGFTGPDGQPFVPRGLNATVQDALAAYANQANGGPQILQDFPNMNAIRLNVDPSKDSMEDISKVIQEYTSHGIVVEAEQHTGGPTDLNWYTQMAQTFKDNPYVMLETRNEPSGDATSVANDQIATINAIRSTGYNNPIGVQPVGGYDESNLQQVVNAVGNAQLYATPHEYYFGTDPNGAQDYFNSLSAGAKNAGLFPWFDEFGNDAGDGYTPAPQGASVITDIINANKAGQAGATFWAMDNGNHNDCDSALLNPDGSQETALAQQYLNNWI